MMKTKIFKTTKALLISLAVLFTAGCSEVGLGSAVDTAAPTVEIAYPPKNAIVRDSFIVSGTCDDDLFVSSVEVTVTNTSTKEVYGPYKATINLERTEWSVLLNQKNEGKNASEEYDAYNSYKQWELPDGSYIVTAIAYDRKDKASQEASVPVDIDNTAPVLLVSKPLATGNEKASVYGRTINITGDVSEEHESAKLTLYYKEYDEREGKFIDEQPRTLEIRGFGTMSSDSPLTIAKYHKLSEQESTTDVLHINYKKIYGEDIDLTKSNKKLYYCGFLLEDNAKVYQNPGDSGVEGGNTTDQYYILSDSYNDDLFNENTYSLNARNLMLLLSGKSSYTEQQIDEIITLLKKPGNSASSCTITETESTKFSVDPKNNPVWSITNLEQWNDDFATFEPGSAIPLVLEAGGDAIAVDKSSIQVELYHLGIELGTINENTPHATLIKKGTYTDGLLKETLNPQNERTIKFYTNQNNENYVSIGLNVNHYYEIIVTGTDVSGNELESKGDNRYGFRRLSSFAAPAISFRSGEGAFTQNEYQSGITVNEQGITIKGTIVTADKDISVEKEKLQITGISITDISDSSKIITTANATENTENENAGSAPEIYYNYEITDFSKQSDGDEATGKIYYFTALIKKADEIANARLIPSEEGSYKYKVTFTAQDSLTSKNEGSDFEFKLDSKAPELTDSLVISPVVSKEDKSYVNGTITITGNITDTGSGFKKLSYAIGNGEVTQITNPGFHWSFDFDTTTLQDNNEYILNIFAEDNVGNKLTVPCNLSVDQSTDNPVITFSNNESIFTKSGNVLVGNITDDDGLQTVSVKYKMLSPNAEESYSTINTGSLTNGTTSYSLNVNLPDAEGEYEIVVNAIDIKGLETGKKSKTVTVKKDNGAPDFTIKAPNSTAETYYNSDVIISGTVKDGSGLVNIERTVYKVVNDSQIKVPELCVQTLTSAITGTASELTAKVVNGTEWTDTIPKTTEGGTYRIVYTAKDKYGTTDSSNDGHTTVKEIEFSMDIDKPLVESVLYGGETVSDRWFNKNYGILFVTTSDTTSSVSSVRYTKDNPQGETVNWVNMSAGAVANNWNSSITFEGSGAGKNLYIKAIDKAGNESEISEISLNIDTTAPVVEVTGLSGNIYVNKTKDIILTAEYYDTPDESGLSPLQFMIGDTDITQNVICVKEQPDNAGVHTYDITLPKESLLSGLFKVIGTDKALNKTVAECCTFIVDTKAPETKDVSITKSYKKSDTEYFIRNKLDGAIRLSGTTTDDNEFEKITLNISDEEHTNTNSISLESTQSSWSFENIDLSTWKKGYAHVILRAVDKAENISTKEFDIKFDEQIPGIITGEGPDNRYTFRGTPVVKYNNLKLGEGRYSKSSYGRMTAISFEAFIDDEGNNSAKEGSGLAKLEYKLFSASDSPENQLSEETLRSYFDNPQTVWAASGTFTLTPDEPYEYFDSNEGMNKNVSGIATKATANISGFNTTAAEKTNYLLLRPTDNCGNTGVITVLTVYVDQTAPVVVTTSTEQLTNGSKPIDLTGSVSDDDSGLKALRVIINGQSGLETVLEINNDSKDENGNRVNSVTNAYGTISYTSNYLFCDAPSSANWALHLTPGEGTWFTELGENAEIYIEAEDWAEHDGKGNIAPNPTKAAVLKIDKIAPEFTIVSPAVGSSVNGENTISGTSSDKGSSPETISLYYSKASVPETINDYIELQTISTKGQNSVNVSELYNFNFDVNFYDSNFIDENVDTQDIWILVVVTDMAGNTSELSPVKYTIDRNTDRPVIKLNSDSINLSKMKKSDNEQEDKPVVLSENQVYINVTDDDGTVKEGSYRIIKDDVVGAWEDLALKNGSGKFTLKQDGKQTVEFKIKDKYDKVFETSAENQWERVYIQDYANYKLDENPELYALRDVSSPDVELEVKLSSDPETAEWRAPETFNTVLGGTAGTTTGNNLKLKIKATDSGTGVDKVQVKVNLNDVPVQGSPFTANSEGSDIYTYTIDCSSGNGLMDVEIVATDKAERTKSIKKQFTIDNTAPEIHLDSPDSGTDQSGVITAVGYTTELVKLYYGITKAENSLPTEYKAYSSYTDNSFTTSGFYIYFDGQNTSTDLDHTEMLNTWLVNLYNDESKDPYITEDKINSTDPNTWYDRITPIYLHLKAVDSAGNTSTSAHEIRVDPQGDRPKVEFIYPAPGDDIPTLGGTINIIGSVTGKAQPYTVYMQIDAGADTAWKQYYTFESIPTLNNQTGIKIDVNGDTWNKKINENKEFDDKTINIRLYAVDNNNLISSKKEKSIKVDSGIPIIDQNMKLVQWNQNFSASNGINVSESGEYTFNEGAVKAMRDYTDGMSVSGKWFVVGKIYSTSLISSINIDKEDFVTKPYSQNGNNANYVFCFPVGDDRNNAVGRTEVTFSATDGKTDNPKSVEKMFNVIYDNLAPEVKELEKDLEIMNSNGFYTFGSEAYEQSVDGVNQTGVERIAFYFTRNIEGQETKVFDPMLNNNTTDYSTLTGNTCSFEDGLYWQKAQVQSVVNNTLTMSSALDDNIHIGGLAKVNGTIYRINGIDGQNITLSGNPGSTTTAMFAFANVIDNTQPETIPKGNEEIKYDDDDGMPERCMKVGTKWTWQASINSKNISDGPVTLHYVVFDKAGNYKELSSTAKIQNNAPRIAGARIGTDENGNGEVDDGKEYSEFISYSNIFEGGYDLLGKKVTNITIPKESTEENPVSAIKVKRNLVIKPEIIGGNGIIGYTYKVGEKDIVKEQPVELGEQGENAGEDSELKNNDKPPEILIKVEDFLRNEIPDGKNQKFIFTIWDSTPGLEYGKTSQSATMNIIMDVEIRDETSAQNKIIPFYWKSASVNSLKDNSSEKGHIELSKDLVNTSLTKTPKISGAVKLEGLAQDNSLLGELTVKIPGYNNGNAITIAKYYTEDNEGNKTYGSWTTFEDGTKWKASITQATYADYVAAGYIAENEIPQGKTSADLVPEVSQDYGHVVHWTMEIDTEAMGLNPQKELEITVAAEDKGKPTYNNETGIVTYASNTFKNNGKDELIEIANVLQTGGDDGNSTYTCKYKVDIVPYIRGIKTALSTKSKKSDSSEYDRTALGHYPVSKDETIYLYGFNLAGGTLYDSAYVDDSITANHKASLGNAQTIGTYESYKDYELYPVSGISSFTSGPVFVRVGTGASAIDSLNNKNWNDAKGIYGAEVPEPEDAGLLSTQTTFSNFYNRKPNTQNNYTLTDDVNLDVWYFNSEAAKPAASGAIFDPVMKINPKQTGDGAGVIGFAYVSGTRRFSMANNNNSYQLWVGDYDNLSGTGFAYDSAGNTYGTALGGDINKDFSNSKFAFMSSLWGPSCTSDHGTKIYNWQTRQEEPRAKHQRIEQIGQIGTKANQSDGTKYIDKNRIQSPSIAVSGSGTSATVYLAYYDHMNQEIRFRWAANPMEDTELNRNRGFTGTSYINDNYTEPVLGNNSNDVNKDKYTTKDFQIIAESGVDNTTSLGEAGPYVSIDVIQKNTTINTNDYDIVVLTWYDKEHKKLMYTYNKKDITATGNFTTGSSGTRGEGDVGLWNDAQEIFSDAGMYCQIKVAADGTIHFAGYDGDSGDVCYAKLSSYSDTSVESCIVDSNGIVGSNLTLDVAMDSENGTAVPYIGYYGSSGPKMAYLSDLGKDAGSVVPGAIGDMFTGYWEVTEIPTESNAVKDRVNVGVWKNGLGVIKDSIPAPEGIVAHEGSGNTSNSGSVYGNGTAYPVLGYEIRPSTDTGYMETAQKQ